MIATFTSGRSVGHDMQSTAEINLMKIVYGDTEIFNCNHHLRILVLDGE